MRTFALLCTLGLAAAGPSLKEQGSCLVDGGEAVTDLMDSAMFIWAAIARCEHDGLEVKCTIAVASAIESVNAMINVILKAVDKCEGLDTENKECGMAASKLTRGVAGITAASAGVYEKCHAMNAGQGAWAHAAPIQCVVGLKSTAKALFKAIKALLKTKKKCKHSESRKCAGNALQIVGAFAGLGQYLSMTLGHCTHELNEEHLGCSEFANMLANKLAKVAEGGVAMSKACEPSRRRRRKPAPAPAPVTVVEVQVPRLYSDDDGEEKKDEASTPSLNLMLGAFLPITAIVGFVGGRVFANRNSRITQTREFMSDNE